MKDTAKPMKGIRIQILALLARKPDLTVADMIDSLSDFTEKQIGDNCYQAKQDGLLTSRMDGITRKQAYSITDLGKARIKSDAATDKESSPFAPDVKPNLTTEKPAVTIDQVIHKIFPASTGELEELRKLVEDGAKENARLHDELAGAQAENRTWRDDTEKLLDEKLRISRALSKADDEASRLREVVASKDGEITRIAFESMQYAEKQERQVTVEQFLIRIPKHKPFVVKSLEKARQQAMRAAKFVGKAEVFAMVPVGDAVRGAVWNQK